MASLRKFPKSPYWFACLTLSDGKRTQRSTKQTNRKAAQKLADEWEVLSKERAKAKQAHKVIADIYKAAHKQALPDATPRSFLSGWLDRRRKEVKPATFSAYEGRITDFLRFLGTTADGAMAEIETTHFTGYRNQLSERVSTGTVNTAIKILRVPFEDARREKLIPDNPAKDCPILKGDHTQKRRPFTLAELRSVLAVATGEWRSMIIFGLYTGQRLGDLAALRWSNVDTAADEIALKTAKTGRVVRVPIVKPLADLIATLPAGEKPTAPLHPQLAQMAKSTLSRSFSELLFSVGLAANPRAAQGKGRAAQRESSGLSFHCLRHTATSMMKNAGVSPAIVQDIIGHDSAEMSAHYTHVESAAKRRALDALPDLT